MRGTFEPSKEMESRVHYLLGRRRHVTWKRKKKKRKKTRQKKQLMASDRFFFFTFTIHSHQLHDNAILMNCKIPNLVFFFFNTYFVKIVIFFYLKVMKWMIEKNPGCSRSNGSAYKQCTRQVLDSYKSRPSSQVYAFLYLNPTIVLRGEISNTNK